MIQLRTYQETIISSLSQSLKQGNKRIVLCAPTGSGELQENSEDDIYF